jgi:hypothetical protein
MIFPGYFQAIDGAGRSDLQGFDTMLQVIDRTGRRRKVKHVVNFATIERLANVLLHKLKARLIRKLGQILRSAS